MAIDESNGRNEMGTLNGEITLEWLYKIGSECELTHGLMAQSVRASERNSVIVGSNPT